MEKEDKLDLTTKIKNMTSIYPKEHDYKKYKQEIDKCFKEKMKKFEIIQEIDINRPMEIFWEIVNGDWKEIDNIYTRLAFHIGYDINLKILLNENKIPQSYAPLQTNWFRYLIEKIFIPYLSDIKIIVLESILCLYPFSANISTLFDVSISTSIESLYNLALSNNNFKEFWKTFTGKFRSEFNIFEKFVNLVAEEIGRIKGGKKLDNFYKIFDLNNENGKRTPKGYNYDLIGLLTTIIHVKNGSISHDNIEFIPLDNPIYIEITDVSRGKITFKEKFSKKDLYNLYINLSCLIIGLKHAGLVAAILKYILTIHNEIELKKIF